MIQAIREASRGRRARALRRPSHEALAECLVAKHSTYADMLFEGHAFVEVWIRPKYLRHARRNGPAPSYTRSDLLAAIEEYDTHTQAIEALSISRTTFYRILRKSC